MRTHAAGDTSPCCAVGCVASGPTTLTAPTPSPAALKALPPPGIGESAGLVEATNALLTCDNGAVEGFITLLRKGIC